MNEIYESKWKGDMAKRLAGIKIGNQLPVISHQKKISDFRAELMGRVKPSIANGRSTFRIVMFLWWNEFFITRVENRMLTFAEKWTGIKMGKPEHGKNISWHKNEKPIKQTGRSIRTQPEDGFQTATAFRVFSGLNSPACSRSWRQLLFSGSDFSVAPCSC